MRVKATPVVASVLGDVSGLEAGAEQDVSLSGLFSDADGDNLAITAVSSDDTIAAVTVASDGLTLTLTGVSEGTATITFTAQDSDGNRVRDASLYRWRRTERNRTRQPGRPRRPCRWTISAWKYRSCGRSP